MSQLISLLDWACYCFDCKYVIDGDWVKITSQTKSMWAFNTKDKERFGEYTLLHRPLGRAHAHTQVKKQSLMMTIWMAVTHDLYKYDLGRSWKQEDYKRWKDDFNYYYKEGLV